MNELMTIDGLVEIAVKHGLIGYSRYSYPTINGLEAKCNLRFPNSVETTTVTMFDVEQAGVSISKVWREHPERMLENFAVRQAIRNRFKEAIECIEKRQ